MNALDKIAPYYKAVVAVVVPFLTQVGAALLEGSDGGSRVTGSEWITATVTSLLAGGVVFAVPNKDPEATHQDESVQPPTVDPAQVIIVADKPLPPADGPQGYGSGV